jgi:hypothetical protein
MFLLNVIDFQQNTGRHIPEDSNLHNHYLENLTSCLHHVYVQFTALCCKWLRNVQVYEHLH